MLLITQMNDALTRVFPANNRLASQHHSEIPVTHGLITDYMGRNVPSSCDGTFANILILRSNPSEKEVAITT